jgi:hypothetical protein
MEITTCGHIKSGDWTVRITKNRYTYSLCYIYGVWISSVFEGSPAKHISARMSGRLYLDDLPDDVLAVLVAHLRQGSGYQ